MSIQFLALGGGGGDYGDSAGLRRAIMVIPSGFLSRGSAVGCGAHEDLHQVSRMDGSCLSLSFLLVGVVRNLPLLVKTSKTS
jgi:hypothetical protein